MYIDYLFMVGLNILPQYRKITKISVNGMSNGFVISGKTNRPNSIQIRPKLLTVVNLEIMWLATVS